MTSFPPTLGALVLILATAMLAAVGVGALAASPRISALAIPTPAPTPRALPTALPGTITGPLDGEPTARVRGERAPLAVMIDNFVGARPQSGLGSASIVYEAPVEGGITRLMALFLEHDSPSLGPVRSARPYFVDWAIAYHSLFVHDGGSPAAQSLASTAPQIINIDAARFGTVFHRETSGSAPHNLYTGTRAVRTLAQLRGWTTARAVHAFRFRGIPASSRPRARSITIRFTPRGATGNPDYTVNYRYDPATDSYLRSVGGAASVDSLSGRQIQVRNVVVLATSINLIPNDPLYRLTVRTTGRGKVTIFRGGEEKTATWFRSPGAPLNFSDSSGFPLYLDPGTTWIEVVSPGSVVVQ